MKVPHEFRAVVLRVRGDLHKVVEVVLLLCHAERGVRAVFEHGYRYGENKVLCAALPNRLVLVRDRAKHGYHVVQVLVHLVEQPLLFDLQVRLQFFGIVVQFALKYPAAALLVRRYFHVYVQHTLVVQERAFERVPPHRVVRVAQIEHFDRIAFVRKRFCVQGVQFALRIGDEHGRFRRALREYLHGGVDERGRFAAARRADDHGVRVLRKVYLVSAPAFDGANRDADEVGSRQFRIRYFLVIFLHFLVRLKMRLFEVRRNVVVPLVALYDLLAVFQPIVLVIIGEHYGQGDHREQKSVEIGLSVHEQVYIGAEFEVIGKQAVEEKARNAGDEPYATDDYQGLFQPQQMLFAPKPQFIPFHLSPFPLGSRRPRVLLRVF